MVLDEILIPTLMARPGMKVGDAFRECVEKHVPGIPYCNDAGEITGRISIRHVFREVCVPSDVVSGAHLLGDELTHLDLPDIEKCRILDEPVERFLLTKTPFLTSNSPVVKAIALMEKFNSTYAFVVDEQYRGVITQLGIATLLLNHLKGYPQGCATDA